MIRWMIMAMTGLLLAGCGGGAVSPETVTVRETVTSVAEPTTTSPVPESSPSATPQSTPTQTSEQAGAWVMPDLIGKNLQDAQNAIQVLTNYRKFFSSSTDLTGQGRQQIIDRNWVVCSSTPPPGAALTRDTAVDFGVVKKDSETCP